MPEEEALPLKPELLKLLASDSRREILRHLKARRMTLSELARAVKLQKATVLEHLGKLTDAGLVQRHEDAERVWVYYSLTREGKRMLSPQRTRFYLVVGVAVMATLFGVVLAVAFGNVGPEPDASGDAGARDALHLEGVDTDAESGERAAFKVRVASGAAPARAFLLTPEDADALRSGSGQAFGTPLTVGAESPPPASGSDGGGDAAGDAADGGASDDAVAQAPDVVTLEAPDGVTPGTYYVYAQSASGADNRDALVPVQVRGVNVTGVPDAWARGVDDAVTLTLTREGAPVNGTLVLRGPGDLERPVENGTVTLDARSLDALPPGAYRVLHAPHADATLASTGRTLLVTDPDVVVTPQQVVADAPVTLNVSVRAVDGPREDVPVTVNGAPLTDAWTPDAPGTASVQLGRLVTHSVRVVPDVRVAFSATADGLAVAVTNSTGAPAWNVTLQLADATVRLDANASAVLTAPPQGPVDVTVTRANASVTRVVVVDGWNVTVPRVPVTLTGADAEGVHVTTRAPSNASGDATRLSVTLLVTGHANGSVFTSSLVDVPVPGTTPLARTVNATTPSGVTTATFTARDVTWPPVTFTNATHGNASGTNGDAPGTPVADDAAESAVVRLRGTTGDATSDARAERVPVNGFDAPATGDAAADGPEGGAGVPAPGAPVVVALALAAAGLAARRRARP